MSWITRNFFNKLNSAYKSTYAAKCPHFIRLYSHKESGLIKNVVNQDILLSSLKSAASSQQILDLISSHHKIMNNKHLMQAFRTLFNLQKSGNSPKLTKSILSNPDFKTLCIALKSQIRSIEINDLVEAIKILSYLNVPANSTIMQIVLQMIRHNVNNLSLQHIIFLDFLLKQFESTPLSDALLIAFPIVFQVQLPMKIDRDNTQQLADLLQYATKNKLPEDTIKYLLEMIFPKRDLSLKIAVSVVWSICDMKQQEYFGPILKKCLKIIVNNNREVSMSDLETTLTKLTFRHSMKHPYYYNREFFDLVAEHLVENDLGFQQALWILVKFAKVGHTHNHLLDYVSTLCKTDPSLILKAEPWNLFILVTAFAGTDYKTHYWESIKQTILANEHLFDAKKEINWIKFATRLASLDLYKPEILQKALEKSYVEKILKDGTQANCAHFLVLYQTLSTLHQEYKNFLPDSSYVTRAAKHLYFSSSEEYDRPLQVPLEKGFGGKAYVLNNISSKLGYLFHHLVVMRKGGYPVAFNVDQINRPQTLENLQMPADSHIVAVFGCDSSYYKQGNKTLKNLYKLMFHTIEIGGCSVVVVNLDTWTNLPDFEKIPYLMQSIRAKNEEFEKMSAVQ